MRHDEVRIGAAIPGVLLRILNVAVIVACCIVMRPAPFWQVLFTLVALAGAVFPRSGLSWLALLVAPLGLVLDDVLLWRTAVALAVVHLGHVLTTLCLAIPARSRVALSALAPTGARFLGVQAAAQAIALAVLLVVGPGGSGISWLAPVGAGAVAVLAFVLLRRMTGPTE